MLRLLVGQLNFLLGLVFCVSRVLRGGGAWVIAKRFLLLVEEECLWLPRGRIGLTGRLVLVGRHDLLSLVGQVHVLLILLVLELVLELRGCVVADEVLEQVSELLQQVLVDVQELTVEGQLGLAEEFFERVLVGVRELECGRVAGYFDALAQLLLLDEVDLENGDRVVLVQQVQAQVELDDVQARVLLQHLVHLLEVLHVGQARVLGVPVLALELLAEEALAQQAHLALSAAVPRVQLRLVVGSSVRDLRPVHGALPELRPVPVAEGQVIFNALIEWPQKLEDLWRQYLLRLRLDIKRLGVEATQRIDVQLLRRVLVLDLLNAAFYLRLRLGAVESLDDRDLLPLLLDVLVVDLLRQPEDLQVAGNDFPDKVLVHAPVELVRVLMLALMRGVVHFRWARLFTT